MEKMFDIEDEIFVILFKKCPPLLEVQARELAKEIVAKINAQKILNAQRIKPEK